MSLTFRLPGALLLTSHSDFLIRQIGSPNRGLVTFRETCVLFDAQNSTTLAKQWIAIVVCHELAHQWVCILPDYNLGHL